jgi:hypothetical protein
LKSSRYFFRRFPVELFREFRITATILPHPHEGQEIIFKLIHHTNGASNAGLSGLSMLRSFSFLFLFSLLRQFSMRARQTASVFSFSKATQDGEVHPQKHYREFGTCVCFKLVRTGSIAVMIDKLNSSFPGAEDEGRCLNKKLSSFLGKER